MAQSEAAASHMTSLLFFDDWMLHAREGLDRHQGQPQRVREVALGAEPDPDLKSIRSGGIRYDPIRGCYMMPCDCRDSLDRRFMLRLETDDPYQWPTQRWKPGPEPLWTRTDNAYLDQNRDPLNCFNVLPLADTHLADRGYVMTLYDYGEKHRGDYTEDTPSAAVGFSQDGLHFEVDEGNCWIPHHSDTGNPPIYDPWSGEFLIFCRPEQTDRRVAQVTTTDFRSFSPPTVVLQPDAEDPVNREFYGLDPLLYDDVFVGLLSVYDTEPTERGYYKMQGTNQMQLAYSYNGRNWYRAFREPFIPRTEPGTASGGSVYAGAPVRTPDDKLLFGAMATWTEHGMDIDHCPEEWKSTLYRTYLYEMRLDGFAYLRTRARQGLIRTKAMIPQGGPLRINVRTTPSGHVRVGLLDTNFDPLLNYTIDDAVPIFGDHVSAEVRWRERNNLDELAGKPVILEVQVREGELYSLRFPYRVLLGEYPHDRV